ALTSRTIVRGSVSGASNWKTSRSADIFPNPLRGLAGWSTTRYSSSMAAPVLLTGATGYIGGRLLHRLEASGRQVRCLSRRPAALATRLGDRTEVVAGDVLDAASLRRAMDGIAA